MELAEEARGALAAAGFPAEAATLDLPRRLERELAELGITGEALAHHALALDRLGALEPWKACPPLGKQPKGDGGSMTGRQTVAFRLDDETLAAVDRYAAERGAALPGAGMTRGEAVRTLIRRGLEAEGVRLEAAPREQHDLSGLETRIAELHGEGLTTRAIAERLNGEGYEAPRGGAVFPTTVHRALHRLRRLGALPTRSAEGRP